MAIIVFGIFIAVGIFGLNYVKKQKGLFQKCTLKISAKCLNVQYEGKGEKRPVWEYYYNGKVYQKRDSYHYKGSKVFQIGDTISLFINPNDPNEFYEEYLLKHSIKNTRICSILFLIFGTMGLISLVRDFIEMVKDIL